MREIKFKVWNVDKKEWIANGVPMDLNYSGRYNCFMFDNDSFDIPKNVIWVQFTGLKDKNGKEIWEGDILQGSETSPKYTVAFPGFWCANYFFKGNGGSVPIFDKSNLFEVIGNIYENPELLK